MYPNNQHENLLNEIETVLATYDPSGYFAGAKFIHQPEDRALEISALDMKPQGKFAIFFLSSDGGSQAESFHEDFRDYQVTIQWKFHEANLTLADRKNKRISDTVRDLFWRKNKGTYYFQCHQVGTDDLDPVLTPMQLDSDGNIEKEGKRLIHRGTQVWIFHTCIDHQAADLSTIKSGTATTGERI